MVENSTQKNEPVTGETEPLAALEQVQRELDELAQAMSTCQSDIDAAARQPGELAKQKAELFDRFQLEHEQAERRRKELEEMEAKLRQKQMTLDRLAKKIESREKAMKAADAGPGLDAETSGVIEARTDNRPATVGRKPVFARLVVDMVVLLMVLSGGAGYWWVQHQEATVQHQIEQIRGAMREIHNQALLHASQGDVPVHASGYPLKIDKSWFTSLPVNGLAAGKTEWLDVAEPMDYGLANPAQIVMTPTEGTFWYNPARGIVRARVPMQMTDNATVDLYNQVNATSLSTEDVDWKAAER